MNNEQSDPHVLILDYSADQSEASLFRRWFPDTCSSTAVNVYSGETVPVPTGFSHVFHTGSSLSICSDSEFLRDADEIVKECVASGIPQMGICYGHQLLCRCLIGSSAVERCSNGLEAGWIDVEMTGSGLDIQGVFPVTRVLESHFDRVVKIPETAEIIARNNHTAIQGFIDMEKKLFSLQFHPEFTREEGNRLFRKDEKLLTENNIDLQAILDNGPSIDAGNVFFGHFFNIFQVY